MKCSEALEKISEAYIPGTAQFYAEQENNPWQAAHDEFETEIVATSSWSEKEKAGETYYHRCFLLIERYKHQRIRTDGISFLDAFHIGNVDRFDHLDGLRSKHCCKCQSKIGIKIIAVSKDSVEVEILCSECKTHSWKKGA